jgi:hypothetical protein
LNGHVHAAQTVKEIEAGESRAYYDDVEIFDWVAHFAILAIFALPAEHAWHRWEADKGPRVSSKGASAVGQVGTRASAPNTL